jgi:hypothetical protein
MAESRQGKSKQSKKSKEDVIYGELPGGAPLRW